MHRILVLAAILTIVLASPAPALDTRAFVTTTDYTSGLLRRADLEPPPVVMPGQLATCSDTRLRWYNGRVYVLNRFGCDNLQIVDPATLATIHQWSTGNGSNPADVAFAQGKAYVTRYELTSLLVMNPETGATIGTVPLGGFADADGIPEMDRMVRVGPWLFVAVQRLDRNAGFLPTDRSEVVVVDTRADTVFDVVPALPGKQGIRLLGKNPVTQFAYDPVSGRLLIGCVGRYGMLDGGIEWVDPVAMTSQGYAITESALGGDLSTIAWNVAARSYAIVSDAGFNTLLKSWSAISGATVGTLYAPGGFSLNDCALNDRGELYVANGSFGSPGLVVFDAGPDTVLAGPLDTGLPPNQITFDHGTGDAAGVDPAPARLTLSAPHPNPASGVVRLTLELDRESEIDISVFDIAGRKVHGLANQRRPAGHASFEWDLRSASGARVSPGIYVVRASAGARHASARVAIVH